MSILQSINARLTRYAAQEQQRSVNDIAAIGGIEGLFYGGWGGPWPLNLTQTLVGTKEESPVDYQNVAGNAYRTNSVIFACMEARRRLFAQGRFQFQQIRNGTPGNMFGTSALDILEHPEAGKTTGDLLGRMLNDVDVWGNFYGIIQQGRLIRLKPDWVTIIMGSASDPDVVAGDVDAEVLGYVYQPGGQRGTSRSAVAFLAEEVAHFAPIPDPQAWYRGMSWVTPLIREVMADSAATAHKLKYFENGATVNLVVSLDASIQQEAFTKWVDEMNKGHQGVANAYKTLYLGAGAVATPVGSNMQQTDFKVTQGAGETRIAAAAGVPPIIVGLSEGLAAATYSNYGQARRAFSDGTMWDLWQNAAGSLETLVRPPSNSRLWVDTRHIPFLLEDKKDAAEVQAMQAQSIRSLLDAGFESDAVIDAVTSGDLDRLTGKHTGLFSVQLQAPGSTKMPAGEVPGEVPVDGGTKPATIPAGDTSTKPLAGSTTQPPPTKRDEEREDLLLGILDRMGRQEPPRLTIENGAFQSTVNVPEREVTFAEGAIRVEAPDPTPVEVTVNVPDQPAPTVNVAAPDPTPIEVRVDVPEQAAPVVNITTPDQPAPIVNVAAPDPTPVEVRVQVPDQPVPVVNFTTPAPVINVNTPAVQDIRIVDAPPINAKVKRDRQGRITDVTSD